MKSIYADADNVHGYVPAELYLKQSNGWMMRIFWIVFHSAALIFAVVTLMSLVRPKLSMAQPAAPLSTTAVQSAVTFPTSANSADPNKVLSLVNKLRTENGIQPLVGDQILTKLAEQRADDMVARRYYAHVNPDGKDFFEIMEDGKYAPQYACENLSLEPSISETASYDSWFISTKGHKECMLDSSVSRAGYASRKLYEIPTSEGMTPYYLVVAIHATQN